MDPAEVEIDDDMVIIAGAAAALVSIIYSMKHIKKSSCWGVKCTQAVVDEIHDPVVVVCPDGQNGHVMQKETEV